MNEIKKTFIVDDKDHKVAVQIDIESFEKMEEVIENYGLYQLMQENKNEKPLSVSEAKQLYNSLNKNE